MVGTLEYSFDLPLSPDIVTHSRKHHGLPASSCVETDESIYPACTYVYLHVPTRSEAELRLYNPVLKAAKWLPHINISVTFRVTR